MAPLSAPGSPREPPAAVTACHLVATGWGVAKGGIKNPPFFSPKFCAGADFGARERAKGELRAAQTPQQLGSLWAGKSGLRGEKLGMGI